jgi:hypothetical protein
MMTLDTAQHGDEEGSNEDTRGRTTTSEEKQSKQQARNSFQLHESKKVDSTMNTTSTSTTAAAEEPQQPQQPPALTTIPPSNQQPIDVPPNGGYGWICVAAVATINGHTWGLNSAYAVFLAHYLSTSTFPGATPLQYAFIGGLSISQALIVSPVATLTTRKYGTRTTLFIGVGFETASFIGASFATRIWHLFVTQGVCFGWGMGFLFVGAYFASPLVWEEWFCEM